MEKEIEVRPTGCSFRFHLFGPWEVEVVEIVSGEPRRSERTVEFKAGSDSRRLAIDYALAIVAVGDSLVIFDRPNWFGGQMQDIAQDKEKIIDHFKEPAK